MMLALWIALNSLLIVWLVQQAWLFSAHYIHLFASGGLPNCILVKQAWRNRYRYQGFACSAFWWWLISVVALFGLLVFEVGFFPVYWLKKVDRVVFFNYLIYFLGYWLCVLALLFL